MEVHWTVGDDGAARDAVPAGLAASRVVARVRTKGEKDADAKSLHRRVADVPHKAGWVHRDDPLEGQRGERPLPAGRKVANNV